MSNIDVRSVIDAFTVPGDFVSAKPFGSGHINDTHVVTMQQARGPTRYLLQRINHHVFHDVPALMQNIARGCDHMRERLAAAGVSDPSRRTLTLVPTHAGPPYHRDPQGNHWRMFLFIENTRGFDVVESPEQAFAAARAFGELQELLKDLPGERLHETIPHFHHTPRRRQALEHAIETDACNRAAQVQHEINWVRSQRDWAGSLIAMQEQNLIPERITHNDTKLNNVLFDDTTGQAICVIDLDTLMPGLVAYDFGDLVRSSTTDTAEDEPDPTKVTMRLPYFDALARGFLEGTAGCLTPREIDSLPLGAMVITLTIGIRFLTDHLQGDVYYKTHRPHHNLTRARTQFALVDSMKRQQDAMHSSIQAAVQ